MTDTESHPSNHNGGPPLDPAETAFATINDLYDEAKNWADGEPITSDEMHDAISSLYDQLHEAGKTADELRKAEKKPHDDAAAEVQNKFNPYVQPKKGKVDLGKSTLGVLLAAWRRKVQEEKAIAAAEAAAEAAKLEAEAQAAMRESSGNLEAREAAEELLKDSKDAAKFARKADKAATTGTGLRTVWIAELKEAGLALDWAYERDPARFMELVQDMANAAVRAGLRDVPGFVVREDKVAR